MKDSPLKYFRMLYEQIPFPIQIIDEEGKILFVNKSFTNLWGYNLSELNEYRITNDSELKKSGILEIILNIFKKQNQITVENFTDSLLKSKEITLPYFKTKIFYATVENKPYAVLFHEDRTEMILTEAEIKKAREANKESDRLKDTFLTVLSHELRTPLNIVLGYASIIKESMKDKIGSEDRIYLDNLYNGSERLYNTITQMLEFAQIEAGNFSLRIETIELSSILRNCVDINTKVATDKGIEIKTNFTDKKILVDVDIQCLENAINNVINNGIKFTQRGFVEIESEFWEDRDLAVCRIKDSGVGITPQYLDHLFLPFSQEDLNIGRNYEGNGLGLALSKRYIEMMGGSLLVDSIKGVGSNFTITLPLSSRMNDPQTRLHDENKRNLKKILLVDDKSESYSLLNAFLKNLYEINIYNFKNFEDDKLESNNSELIILDVNQTQWKEALKVCNEMKRTDMKKRPVIIVSSEFVQSKIKEFYDAGADKFIVKPFSKKDILKALEECLD